MTIRAGIVVGAALVLLSPAACKRPSGGGTTQGSQGPGTAPSGATDVKLPSSTARGVYKEDALAVTIGQTGIRIGETRAAIIPLPPAAEAAQGVTAEYKGGARATFFLPSLADAIKAHWGDASPESPHATLVVDEGVPYRVLVEVLFTMGRLSVSDLCLAVHKDGRRACIEYKMPRSTPPPALASGSAGALAAPSTAPVQRPEIGPLTNNVISVWLRKDGYAINGGAVAGGCDKAGGGAGVPKIDGQFDTAGLRKCLQKLRGATGDAGTGSFTLTAPGDTTFQVIVDTLDAARETDDGQPLMPPVMFAVPA